MQTQNPAYIEPPYYIIKLYSHNPLRCVSPDVDTICVKTAQDARDYLDGVDDTSYRMARLRYYNGKWTKDARWENGNTLWMPAKHRDGQPAIRSGSAPEHPTLAKLKQQWGEAVRHVWTAKQMLGEETGTVEVASSYLQENFPSLGSGAESLGRAAVYFGRGERYVPEWLEGFTTEERAVKVSFA